MKRPPHETPLGQMIHALRVELEKDDLTLGEVFDAIKTSGHSMITIFFCVPFLQPVPLPGLSTPLGLMIALLAVLQAWGAEPWIPKAWRERKLSGKILKRIIAALERGAERISRWLYPRWPYWVESRPVRWFNAFLVATCGLFLALPLPIPFSNTVPAVVIVILSLGWIERDGLLIAVGQLLYVGCLAFFASVAAIL